jgi:hypothetical protein
MIGVIEKNCLQKRWFEDYSGELNAPGKIFILLGVFEVPGYLYFL